MTVVGKMARRFASTNKVGDHGERDVTDYLRAAGFDVQDMKRKAPRYFFDLLTRTNRLGYSVKADGDFLGGLFDGIAWSRARCIRYQVKTYATVRGPGAEWKAAVERLRHPPGTTSEWWCRVAGPGPARWKVWSYQPGSGWMQYMAQYDEGDVQ